MGVTKRWTSKIIQGLLVLAIVIAINVIAQYFYTYFDLTEEKRFTLSQSTEELIENVDEQIYIELLLEGEFPSGFKRLQQATIELLDQFKSINSEIDYMTFNPSEGTVAETNAIKNQLLERGMAPNNLLVKDGDKMTERLIYPYAIVKLGAREIAVNLLEAQIPNVPQEVTLNNSVSLLEYKIGSAISKLTSADKPNIVFTKGQGELLPIQTAKLFEELKVNYDVGYLSLDSLIAIGAEADIVVVAKPRLTFSAKDQFKLDQYIMNGGRVIFLIDQFEVNLDSINQNQMYVPKPIEHGLDNLLFKYGVRINQDLALDFECTRIPQVIGRAGGQAQTELFPWYYHVFVAPKSDHPVVKSIDRVNLMFPSSLDIIETKDDIKKTVLLSTSNYSRRQIYPMRLNFDIVKMAPDEDQFNKKNLPMGIMLEGSFESLFKNRVQPEMEAGLKKLNLSFIEQGKPSKIMVVTDGDFIKNLYNPKNNTISPIAYNQWEQKEFRGNKQFIFNAIEYMLDDYGLIEARTKDVKLRLLDSVKTKNEKLKWQLINILLPLIFILIFGFIFNYRRRLKYGKEAA